MGIFSERVQEIWNNWKLQGLVLLSLLCRVSLVIFGSQRKYRRGSFISSLVWATYFSADWLATISLGTLANSQRCKQYCESSSLAPSQAPTEGTDDILLALWAPFLLLHLGSPDTITAYSLKDNNLWVRHFLQLFIQGGVAFNLYVRSWTNTPFTFIPIPVFLSGILKYSERVHFLRSASTAQFEDSLVTPRLLSSTARAPGNTDNSDLEIECLHKAYSLFLLLKRLYANLSLGAAEGRRSYSLIVKDAESSDYAFKLVELQLGFLYDALYTKASVIYSLTGFISRFISFICILSALIAFDALARNHHISTDIYVTYVLFVTAVFLEICAIYSLIFSDWTMCWLTKNRTPLRNIIVSAISACSFLRCEKRWSKSMAQDNLISFCLNPHVRRYTGGDFLYGSRFTMLLCWQRKWQDVDADLESLIFKQLLAKHKAYVAGEFELESLLAHKGDFVLQKRHCDGIIGSITDLPFNDSLLVWHVATDICFYNDKSNPMKQQDPKCKEAEISKKISDYMLYLLLMRPFMLPKWIGRIRFVRDTYRDATSILHQKQFLGKDIAGACSMLLQLHTDQPRALKRLRREKNSKSVLQDACRLAEQLLLASNRWEVICEVWIEKLTYAASHCEWKAHAQQLQRGGEFLTHVCLLMAELGISQQFDRRRPWFKTNSENMGLGWKWERSNAVLDS